MMPLAECADRSQVDFEAGKKLDEAAGEAVRKLAEMRVIEGKSLMADIDRRLSVIAGHLKNARREVQAKMIEHFTRALAKEIGHRGVTVNTVAPGAVDTPFFHAEETPQSVDYVKKAHVSGRLAAVDDIAGTVAFLASPRAQWVSAQTIFVNNAYLAR